MLDAALVRPGRIDRKVRPLLFFFIIIKKPNSVCLLLRFKCYNRFTVNPTMNVAFEIILIIIISVSSMIISLIFLILKNFCFHNCFKVIIIVITCIILIIFINMNFIFCIVLVLSLSLYFIVLIIIII